MIVSLLKKGYNVYIISFILLSALFGNRVNANSGGHLGDPPGRYMPAPSEKHADDAPGAAAVERRGNRLYFTPACPIVAQNFNLAADVNGATSDPTATVGWSLDATHVTGATYFAIKSHRIKAQTLNGEGVWYSKVVSIAGYTGIQVDAKVSSEGTLSSSEYVKVYYKLDGGPETLISAQFGSFGTPLVTSPQMTGSTVQIVIRIFNTTTGNAEYYIEQYDVFKETGPCTLGPITVTAGASNNGVLDCNHATTTLNETDTRSGTTTYSWTGPNNFTSTSASPVVSTAGTYTVTATNSTGSGSGSVTVTTNNTAPGAGITSSSSTNLLTCASPSIVLTGTSSTSGVSFSWTGPSFTANTAAATVTAPGTYTVTATNPTNGCISTASQAITQNITPPASVTASNSGPLTCAHTSVTLAVTPTTSGVNYSWTGPNGFTASGATATATAAGAYTVTATSSTTGCTTTASTTVTQNITPPASVTASNSGPLTCAHTSVTLNVNPTASGVNYNWTGPNGFTASIANPTVNTAGTYNLTVTDQTNGCTATAATVVTQSTTPPANVAIVSSVLSNQLTCANSSISLTGSSSTPGVSYSWSGPNGFSVNAVTTTVFNPGVYTLTVTNTATGCASTATITITQNTVAPTGVTSTPSAVTLTCSSPNASLTASSQTAGVTYTWTGPNSFTASGPTTNVGAAGTYVLTAMDPTNGCTTSTPSTVVQNFTAPADVTAINLGPLTCASPSVNLVGHSSTAGVTYSWTGPNGFTANTATAPVSTAGTYVLTVSNPDNGCTAIATTIVAQNTTAVPGLLITSSPISPILTCTNSSVSLTASSGVTGATYSWTGPGNFTSNAATISVSTPGAYSVLATNAATGCTSNTIINVTQNIAPPAALATVSDPINATLTCSTTSITLTASSAVTGANYSWTGPNSFTGSAAAATITAPGTYTVTATDPSNGCSSTASAIVSQNITAPVGLKSTPNPTNSLITCTHPNVVLTASATTTTVLYSWTGANSFTATGPVATITAPGSYRLTATDTTNGCTSFVTAPVSRNITAPNGVTTTTSDVLTCLITDVFVKGTSNTTGALFSWTGPGDFTASTAIAHTSTPCTYNLTVTNPVNGCTATANTIVTSNTSAPSGAAATNTGPLNCVNTSVNVIGSSTTTGVSYNWAAPDNSLLQGATVSVTLAGTYTLVVTDSSNGCTATATTTVTQNTTGCTGSSVQSNSSSTSSKLLTAGGADSMQGATGFEYKVYPNPFSGRAYIEFKSPASSLVTMEIYSNTGVLKRILFNSAVIANQTYKLELNKGSLSPGVYFCMIRSNGKVYSTKLILIDP
jgi:hypothetical protein